MYFTLISVLVTAIKCGVDVSPYSCSFLQSNHFGVLALPVGEFLGLLHDAVYVGACAVDGDLRRSSSTGTGTSSPAHKSTTAPTASTAAASSPSASAVAGEHQFFAQHGGSVKPVRLRSTTNDFRFQNAHKEQKSSSNYVAKGLTAHLFRLYCSTALVHVSW